jgi:hypothetical protein
MPQLQELVGVPQAPTRLQLGVAFPEGATVSELRRTTLDLPGGHRSGRKQEAMEASVGRILSCEHLYKALLRFERSRLSAVPLSEIAERDGSLRPQRKGPVDRSTAPMARQILPVSLQSLRICKGIGLRDSEH